MHRNGPEEAARHPRKCPVCRVAMVGERSAQGLDEPDVFRCLNCGSIVAGLPETGPPAGSDGRVTADAAGTPAPPRAISAVDRFVIRQNIAIYERQLAREADAGRRALLLRLLDQERAKQAPPEDRPKTGAE